MKFIHAIVFTPDEISNEILPSDWDEMCSGDYIVHALYSVDQDHIIILEDNCHAPVENMIDNFLIGTQFALNQKPQVTKCYVIADDPYSAREVAEKIRNSDFIP